MKTQSCATCEHSPEQHDQTDRYWRKCLVPGCKCGYYETNQRGPRPKHSTPAARLRAWRAKQKTQTQ